MKKNGNLLLLLFMLTMCYMGCSSDEDPLTDPRPAEGKTDIDSIFGDNRFQLTDSILGTWKLSKQGREVWESYPWILEIREDSTFTLRYTPYQKPEWLEREGTYFFPNGANIWDSPYNGARVFEIEFVVPGVVFETPQRFTCYFWPDSMRLYDVYNINVFDVSHLYLRVKENE